MKKRLYSVVLLFSFFFCSGGFLVAHGEEPGNDNTGYLPSVLLGNLNITKGEGLDKNGLGYAVLNGSHQTLFHSTTSGSYIDAPAGWDIGSVTFYFGEQSGKPSLTSGRVMAQPDGLYAITFLSSAGHAECRSAPANFEWVGWSGNTVYLRCISPYPLSATFNFTSLISINSSAKFTVSSLSVQYLGQYGESGTDDLVAAIQNQTSELDQSITDAGQGVQDKIESQYDTSQGSEVGSAAQGFADQASESLGVVSYVDTLFSGLSGLVTAGSTTLTFPAFAIAVQGTDYQVWEEHTFDLSQLDGWFSGLMAAVRLATSVVVVGAVIHYLQSVYKDVIG
ncbi:MAG: hypothetical protein ACLTV4_03860 [Ruthenibacterium lactatiformans]